MGFAEQLRTGSSTSLGLLGPKLLLQVGVWELDPSMWKCPACAWRRVALSHLHPSARGSRPLPDTPPPSPWGAQSLHSKATVKTTERHSASGGLSLTHGGAHGARCPARAFTRQSPSTSQQVTDLATERVRSWPRT